MYYPTQWKDHVTNPSNCFNITKNDDGTYQITRAGTVMQQGTPQDAYAAGEIDLDYALSVITSYRGLFKDVTSDAFLEKMLDEFVLSRPALEA